jgi:broad specificity phosphatase PhoE
MRIFLVRHGESVSDVENRYGGSYDDNLTERGRSQAKKLAVRLSRKGIEVIYTSNLNRAKETAQLLGKALDRPVKPLESVRERNAYGVLTGMKKDEAAKKYPKEAELLKSYKNTVQGGEGYETFKARILFSLENMAKSGHQSIAIVTHGGPISCIFRELFKKELRRIGDCAFFEVHYENGFRLVDMDNAELEK